VAAERDPDLAPTPPADPSVVRTPALPSFNTAVIGQTGLKQFGGFLQEEFLPALRGDAGRRKYREMADNDAIIGAVVFALTTMFRSVEWHVESAEDPERAQRELEKAQAKKQAQYEQQRQQAESQAMVSQAQWNEEPIEPHHAIGSNFPPEPIDVEDPNEPPTPCEEAVTFVEEVLEDMEFPMEAVMAEIASMFVYGFAPHEILWKQRIGPKEKDPAKRSRYDDGMVGIRGLPLRKQTTIYRWDIDVSTGTILGLWQQPWTGAMLYIPIDKMLLFRTTEEGNNPEGRSILRNAYRPWYFKRRLEEIEAIGVERDMAGLPVARIPSSYMRPDADPNDRAVFTAYQNLVANIRADRNNGVVIPSDVGKDNEKLFDLELLSTGGSRAIQTDPILQRYAKEIATSVLADFIFLGQGSTGSFALSDNKTDLFKQAVTSFVQSVAAAFNRTLLPALWDLNDLPAETMPRLALGDVEKGNLEAMGAFLQAMSSAGAALFPDDELENHLRKAAGWPPVPEAGMDERNAKGGGAGSVPPGFGGSQPPPAFG
jgi:hypothetical protein